MDAGIWVVLAALALALVFGTYRHLTDGRARRVRPDTLDADQLGAPLGASATFVQFSSSVCAPCRTTHRLLSEVVATHDSLAHVDLDAETRLDLVERFGVMRTPTVLLLDAGGGVRHRFVGVPRRDEVGAALATLG